MILTIENLAKSYGEKVLFNNVNLGLDEGDKIGIVGVNGTGKSTFLKTIAGQLVPDQGNFVRMRNLRLEYLAQDKPLEAENTVLMEVFRGSSPLMQALRSYEIALQQGEQHPQDAAAQKAILQGAAKIDALDGWQLESNAKMILTQLGIVDFSALVGTLSGGAQKRLALATALIQPCDLLLLDEPTNHLDSETIAWLEEYLHRQKGALMMVTHDRYFLDHVATRILELDRGRAFTYTGNYTEFLEQKAAREEREEASERKRQNFLRNELLWMRRGAQARSTKQKARIERYEDVKAQSGYAPQAKVEFGLAGSRLGRTVIELEQAGVRLPDGKWLVKDFSYIVHKRDRIGILGSNGMGKTTLLNLIAGRISPTMGTVKLGQTVKLGYFTQNNTEMDTRMRAIEYIQEAAHFLTLADGSRLSASQLMERFLFPGDLQWTPISRLSGGEKRRLYLLRILMSEPNVLLLDEPTNDLDLETMAVLEDFIDQFQGAILFVTHDRFFLDRLATKVFAAQGEGKWEIHTGGYSAYQADHQQVEAPERPISREKEKVSSSAEKETSSRDLSKKPRRFTFREQKEYEEIDAVIASREGELKVIRLQMAECAADYTRLGELGKEEARLAAELDHLMERWAYLEEIAEEQN